MGRRDEIVIAASKVFAEKGFSKATMDDIALECGVSKGTLYLYFSSKNALIGALYAYEMSLYMQAVSLAAHHEGTPPEKVYKFLRFVETTFREQEALVKLMPELIMYIAQNPSLMEMEKTITSTTLNLLQDILEEGIRDGYFRQLDAGAAATTILGATSGVLLQSYFNPELSLKLSLDYLSEFIMRGLNND